MQQQGRKLWVAIHELFDVVFHLDGGMDKRPKMRGSDKGQKREDILTAFAAEGMSQYFLSALRVHRIHKDQSAKRKPRISDLRFRYREWANRAAYSFPPSCCKSVQGPAAKAEGFAEAS